MSNRKTTIEKIEAAKAEKLQMEARIKKLLQEQKAEERKARNHRFCKRGGFMEKLMPDLALLTDEQFETFFKKTTANNFGRNALAELLPLAADGNGSDPAQSGNTAAEKTNGNPQGNNNPTPKPAQTAHNNGANNHNATAQAARVAG